MKQLLEGIKVVDMTNNFAGPATAANLADFGAEVIHIEKPVLGDDCRGFPPIYDGVSLGHCGYNRGKKSVVLDSKDPVAMEVLKKMIAEADVLTESFRPGVMARMGLSYDDVQKINPNIIYCSVSAFGQSGPYATKPGYDVIAQAFSGIMHKTGEADGPPMMVGITIGDAVGAINGFGCIMAALFHRERTGEGQHIDVSLARGLLWANSYFENINIGVDSTRNGNHNTALTPYGLFEGRDGALIIAAISTSLFNKLFTLMGLETLINDERCSSLPVRVENKAFINGLINDWVMSHDSVLDVIAKLDAEGIPAAKVNNHTDLLNDPHARECGWIVEVPGGNATKTNSSYMSRGVLADFSATPGDPCHAAPALGEHNYEVLTKYGLSIEEIDALQEKWTVAFRAKHGSTR